MENLQKKVDGYDFSVFDKVEKFYQGNGPKDVDVWVLMGNESAYGTGNAFKPNQCVIFLREFNLGKEKNLDYDFAVLIHEVFHLFQGLGQKKDNSFYEKVANCFAPRGILIGCEPENSFLYDEIKKAFLRGKNYLSFEKRYLEKKKGGVKHG